MRDRVIATEEENQRKLEIPQRAMEILPASLSLTTFFLRAALNINTRAYRKLSFIVELLV